MQVERERDRVPAYPFVDLQMTSETESHRAQLQAGTVRSATHLYTLGEGERGKEVGWTTSPMLQNIWVTTPVDW